MECNKEEAIRAKELAEKKMEGKDFVGARKFALRAQQLYPDLKDILQMILVCDVHCAAQKKVYGGESDWYGILQVQPTVDEAAIKKQYRKFALLLHPDKNQFSGASDAFKFIGEAHKVLVDHQRRAAFDSRYKAAGRFPASNLATQHRSRQPNAQAYPWSQNNFTNNVAPKFVNQQTQQPKKQTQPVPDTNQPTFWTFCPFCSVSYQYYRTSVNKLLICQSCKKQFIAYETNVPNGTVGTSSNRPEFVQNKGVNISLGRSSAVPSSTSTTNQGSHNLENLKGDPGLEKQFTSEGKEEPVQYNDCQEKKVQSHNNRKRSESAEDSESFETESSTDSEDMVVQEDTDHPLGENSGYHTVQDLRRSTRFKQKVSYDENLSDDDGLAKPSKRAKSSEFVNLDEQDEVVRVQKQSGFTADIPKRESEAFSSDPTLQNEKPEAEKALSISSDDESCGPETYEYPDPDFNDFDESRRAGCFSPGQVWAIYDTLDGMPRYYALIKKVLSSSFKVRITWLEPNPDDEVEIRWVNEGLPASCGKFVPGKSEDTEHHPMFSHLAKWEKGERRNIYKIYPRQGEIWAIFKNWDLNWHSISPDKKKYEYEFVEVLADYDDKVGVRVAYLGKLQGFACLFCRTLKAGREFEIIAVEHIFKFSHKVPSFQMTGEEGNNVPLGSFELDPASLPACHDGIDVVEHPYSNTGKMNLNGSSSRSAGCILEQKDELKRDQCPARSVELEAHAAEGANVSADKPDQVQRKSFQGEAGERDCQTHSRKASASSPVDIASSPDSSSQDFVVPDQDFHNFDADKASDKFQLDQIWAMYSDEDALPKYYGIIKKIDSPPNFVVHLTWLTACSTPKDRIQWVDKRMPVSCGDFKVGRRKVHRYVESGPFSHQVTVQPSVEKNVYTILPQTGDVWALYKDWNENITCSDLENCEYDIVEVLGTNNTGFEVSVLELVRGYKSVFKPQMGQNSKVTMKIPWAELLRFSHQIPAVQLSEENEGKLRGFWELDTAALPVNFFSFADAL